MAGIPATISTEILEEFSGRPVAYVDATGVVVFAYQRADGSFVIEICTRDDSGYEMDVLLDGIPLLQHCSGPVLPCTA